MFFVYGLFRIIFFFISEFSFFKSSGRFVVTFLLVILCAPFVNGVTCNSQNVIGLPYLFIGFVDRSLVDFRIFCSIRFSISSMFYVSIKPLLPFWSTTVITFGSSSVIGLAFISIPGVVVAFAFLPLINFLRPLPYTGLIVVFSFPVFCPVPFPLVLVCYIFLSVLMLRLGPLCLLPVVLVVRIFHLFPSCFLPVVKMASEKLGSMVCLFVFCELFCFYRLLSCVFFRPPRFWFVFVCFFKFFFVLFFSRNKYGRLLLTSSFGFLGAFITNWS